MLIQDSVALVTGGARGIGETIADALLERGAKVCIVDILDAGRATSKSFESKYGEGRVMFVQADVTSKEELEGAFQQTQGAFGKVDILVNNAGIMNEHDWLRTIGVNLIAVVTGSKLAQSAMASGNGGVIVNIASTSGIYPFSLAPVYSASKTAVVGFTKSCALSPDYAHNGIRMNCLCPGPTKTPIVNDINETTMTHFSTMMATFQKAQELGMLLEPAAMVDGVMQLIEDDTKTGEIVAVTSRGTEIMPYPHDPMIAMGKTEMEKP